MLAILAMLAMLAMGSEAPWVAETAEVGPLQPRHREPAVDVDNRAGRVGQIAAHESGDGAADVLRLTPAPFRHQAVGDARVVDVAYHRGHVGSDDAGTDLVDRDAERRQPDREEAR